VDEGTLGTRPSTFCLLPRKATRSFLLLTSSTPYLRALTVTLVDNIIVLDYLLRVIAQLFQDVSSPYLASIK